MATVARALILLWNESARVVDPAGYQTYAWDDWSKLRPKDGEPFIRAVQFRLRVPEVITLTAYVNGRVPTRPPETAGQHRRTNQSLCQPIIR